MLNKNFKSISITVLLLLVLLASCGSEEAPSLASVPPSQAPPSAVPTDVPLPTETIITTGIVKGCIVTEEEDTEVTEFELVDEDLLYNKSFDVDASGCAVQSRVPPGSYIIGAYDGPGGFVDTTYTCGYSFNVDAGQRYAFELSVPSCEVTVLEGE